MSRSAATSPAASTPAASSALPPARCSRQSRPTPSPSTTIAYDEAPIAREMAESMDADQEVINLSADDLYGQNYIDTVWHAERTFYNTLGVAKNLMSKRVWDSGYRCVITGEGADELFAGYPALKRDMFLHGLEHEPESRPRRIPGGAGAHQQALQGRHPVRERAHPSRPGKRSAVSPHRGSSPGWTRSTSRGRSSRDDLQHELLRLRPDRRDRLADRPAACSTGGHPLDKAQYTWSKCQLEGQILNWGGDRVDMANSMESRPAFLDHHLAAVAVQVPPQPAHQGQHREARAARGGQGRPARGALHAREVRLHGTARPHRCIEAG